MSKQEKPDKSRSGTIRHISHGLLMGAADVVPGVSGGTVALVLGIYNRLITAISHLDVKLFRLLRQRQWSEAARHFDILFLLQLALGILIGIGGMSLIIHELLDSPQTRPITLAVFFGMILASGVLVARLVDWGDSAGHGVACLILAILGGAFSWWLTTWQGPHDPENPSALYLFATGAIAICAMILPGISGAMILYILGVYSYVTGIPKGLLHGENIGHNLLQFSIFVAGCGTGLICFSKVLRWLLQRYSSATMALLCGFMFGALRKLWPFQRELPTDVVPAPKHPPTELYWPAGDDSHLMLVIAAAIFSVLMVLAADQAARRSQRLAS